MVFLFYHKRLSYIHHLFLISAPLWHKFVVFYVIVSCSCVTYSIYNRSNTVYVHILDETVFFGRVALLRLISISIATLPILA